MNRNGIWAPKSPVRRAPASSPSGLGWRQPPRRHGDGEGCAAAAGLQPPSVSQHSAQHGPKAFQVSAGAGKSFSTPLVAGIWRILPEAVTEVDLLAKSNWMLP